MLGGEGGREVSVEEDRQCRGCRKEEGILKEERRGIFNGKLIVEGNSYRILVREGCWRVVED